MKPLSGLTVLDMSRVLAGPMCAQALGDLGAQVIKIESTGGGDESRTWPPFYGDLATAFITANRNKRSISLDLKASEGLAVVHELVRGCDVLVESSVPGAAARLGIDYETLKNINPRLIYCSISGFGQRGPLCQLRGYDMILQAYSGMMSITGEEGGEAIRVPFSPIDQATGHHAVTGILAALLQRGISGEGCSIDVSLFETAASFLGYTLQAYVSTGQVPGKSGSRHSGIVPYQVFKSADKEVFIGIANDRAWRAFCYEFGCEEFVDHELYARNEDRVANREATVAVVQERVANMDAVSLLRKLERAGVPCAPINDIKDLLLSPHAAARGVIAPITGRAALEGMKAVVMPIVFNDRPRDVGLPPPLLGEHTDEILASLGYLPEMIDALERAGVVQRSGGTSN